MGTKHTTNPYEMLARHLDETPLGAPQAPELMNLLMGLFTPAEAELCSRLPFTPKRVKPLAAELGLDQDLLAQDLAALADRGVLYQRRFKNGDACYSLLPVVPGICELQFMDGTVSEEKKKLAALFEAYYEPGIGSAMTNSQTPYSRVIPVGRSVENNQAILPHERAEEVIKAQEVIALTNCYCRQEAELLGNGCGNPKEVCMLFGSFANFAADKGWARLIDHDQAMEVIKIAEDAGLVHVTDNVAQGANFMCNCCGCCCLFLKTITKLDKPGAVAQAAYLANVDQGLCTACHACMERCQVSAITPDPEELAQVDPERCLGCGQCQMVCPVDAISMEPRRTAPPAANWWELTSLLGPARRIKQETTGCNT